MGNRLSTDIIKFSGGLLITSVAIFELYRNRNGITRHIMNFLEKTTDPGEEPGAAITGALSLSTHEDYLDRTNLLSLNNTCSVHDMYGLSKSRVGDTLESSTQ